MAAFASQILLRCDVSPLASHTNSLCAFVLALLARGRGVYVWMSLQEIAILFRYLALVIQTLGVSGV